jgi:hypothetical protein
MTEIPGVGWALWSKKAGTSSDYSVLSCSPELFGRGDFAKIITRFAGGNPDSQATGAEKLPWVTLSWVGVDANLHVGIAVTDNTGQVDAVGRPIIATTYLCVPYQEVARARLSYTALFEAASPARLRLPSQDGALITLRVPDEAPDAAVRRVEKDFDERITSATAALLLRGPVTITQADGSSLAQRLAFIDAVASLLPFGLRAKLTAGTWSDSGVRHRLRLAFASRPREDAATVPWRHGSEVTGDDVARQYFDQLRQLRTGTATHGKPFDATTVVSHLAASTEQQKFEQPQDAFAFLRLIDLPDRVLVQIRSGTPVDIAELRQVFRLGHLDTLGSDDKTDLLTELSRIGEARDWPDLKAGLGQVQDSRTAWSILTRFGSRVLWSGTPNEDVLGECMTTAHGHGIGDNVLGGLVRMPDSAAGPSRGATAAAGLLAATVLSSGAASGAYPVTRDGLAGQPAAMAEYLAALASSGQDAAGLLSWLATAPPTAMVGAFRSVLGLRQTEVRRTDMASLAEIDARCARALLATAAATGRLDMALTAFTRWIVDCDELSPRALESWSTHLRPLSVAAPRLRAHLDLALMAVGADPIAFPPFRQPDAGEYLDGFLEAWKPLRRSSGLRRCIGALARYLEKPKWAEARAQAEAVIALVEQLRRDDEENRLVAVVASVLNTSSSTRQWDFAKKWLAEINAKAPEAVGAGLLSSLATAGPGTDPRHVADLCLMAHRQGIAEGAAFYRLAESKAIDSARAACELLAALRLEFAMAGEPAQNWCLEFAQEVMRGKFGQDVAEGFRVLQSRNSRKEIWLQLELLRTIAERPDRSGQGVPDLTDEERADLDQVRDDIELLAKKSPMRALFRKVWRE